MDALKGKLCYRVRAIQKSMGKTLYERDLTDEEGSDPVKRAEIANALLKQYPDCSCVVTPYTKWES